MALKTNKIKPERKHLYKLLDSFDEKSFFAVQNFAEYLKENNGNDELMKLLMKAPYDDEGELNEQTIKDIKKSRLELKNGKTRSLAEVKKDLGL